jgi:cytochrome c-type biogenesis protein CcmH
MSAGRLMKSSRRVAAARMLAAGLVALTAICTGAEAISARPAEQTERDVSPSELRSMVKQLTRRLQSQPDDIEGWQLLALAQQLLERDTEAAQAYERVLALGGRTPDMLVRYADVLARIAGGRVQGEPYKHVKEALAVDPDHIPGLALAAQAEAELGRLTAAADYWDRMARQLPRDSAAAARARDLAAQARRKAGAAN